MVCHSSSKQVCCSGGPHVTECNPDSFTQTFFDFTNHLHVKLGNLLC
uniref:Uncharacterized protein n=1 Tax=Anguilla anguilla TaxID=7936 RepID=A0A0E9RNR8_ANGAN